MRGKGNMVEENSLSNDYPTEVFLSGGSVFLRMPNIESDIIHGRWHEWFNDSEITKYLVHGVYPIDKSGEAELIKEEMKRASSLILCVIEKEKNKHIGVISLKNIDLINRTAEISIVMGPNQNSIAAIEAMSLLMRHAFDRLNLSLLYSGQHEALWKWVNTLSLIGFGIDGFRKQAGFRKGKSYGILHTSVSSEDFYELQRLRNGNILTDNPIQLLRSRKKTNPLVELEAAIDGFNREWRGI